MTRQSPYAWPPRPSRAPQHAATLSGNAVLPGRVRRAVMLILIASGWAAGLSLVIAAVTVVALATGPVARTSNAAVAQGEPASHGRMAGDAKGGGSMITGQDRAGQARAGYGQAGPGQVRQGRTSNGLGSRRRPKHNSPATAGPATAGPSAPIQIHAQYVGTGSANTSTFTIGGNGRWRIAWIYGCAGLGKGGFTVSQDGAGSVDGPHVSRAGTTGRGVIWADRDPGTHYLAIRTPCRWQITVTSHP